MMVEYRDRVRRKYEELDAAKGTVEGEWRQYKDASVEVAEELCGRTSGRYTNKQKQRMVDGRGAGEAGSTEDDRRHERQMGATAHLIKAPVWPDGEGSHECGGQSTEEYGGRNVPKA